MAITNAWLKANNNKPVEKSSMVADRDGLNVRVSKTGTLTFTMRYRHAGKADQMALGSYPTMSLAEAREKNLEYRALLLEGKNPKQQKIEKLKSNIEALTLEQLFEQWFDRNVKGQYHKDRENSRRNIFNNDVFPKFGKRLAEDISLHEWLDLIETIQKRAPTTAASLLSYAKQMYHFGVIRELIPDNPVGNISATTDLRIEKNVRDRYFEDGELRLFLRALEDGALSRRHELYTLLCLFYGCRPTELRRAEKRHFDFDAMTWTVPKQNHKTGKKMKRAIVRPIIPEVVPLIKELMEFSPSELVISKIKLRGPGSEKLIGTKLTDSFFSNWNTMIDQFMKKNYETTLDPWSLYDLRKTMRTNLGRIGEETRNRIAPYHICEIMLGHKLPGDWVAYDKNVYLDQQREAYSAWWARIHAIKAGADNVKVVNFR